MKIMARTHSCVWAFVLAQSLLRAQAPPGSDGPVRVASGVRPPVALRKVQPEYTSVARAAHVHGTVVLQGVINGEGRAVNITVLRPLSFGLDEKAIAAVEKWEFAPATMGGKPVAVMATFEVNFRLVGGSPGGKFESRWAAFRAAQGILNRADSTAADIEGAVRAMQNLCRQEFPPAMYIVGTWKTKGEHPKKDPKDGLALIQKAAAKDYGPALYEIAGRRIEGRDFSKDIEKGLEEMRQAAVLDSPQAQFSLGGRYERGDGVPRDLERARWYFRLCAAQGVATCQYRLGTLLLYAPGQPGGHHSLAVALFELAAEQGLDQAKEIASKEAANLTPAERKQVDGLKTQLVRK